MGRFCTIILAISTFASFSHVPLEAHEKPMKAFPFGKEMARSHQDNCTKTARLKFVFTIILKVTKR